MYLSESDYVSHCAVSPVMESFVQRQKRQSRKICCRLCMNYFFSITIVSILYFSVTKPQWQQNQLALIQFCMLLI